MDVQYGFNPVDSALPGQIRCVCNRFIQLLHAFDNTFYREITSLDVEHVLLHVQNVIVPQLRLCTDVSLSKALDGI